MKVLLIGPHPPPHGGISVHVSGIRERLDAAGVTCRVLDIGVVRPGLRFCLEMLRHAVQGWTLHFHTTGHNVKSWILAFSCAVAGRFGNGSILTLHSGMVPGYLESASPMRRRLAAMACSLCRVVVAVNPAIRNALLALGVEERRTEVLPAFLNTAKPAVALDSSLTHWMAEHRPLFSTALFFRPEYGFDLLVDALARLRSTHPGFGCLVMGSGEQRGEAEARVLAAGLEEHVRLLGDVDHDTCLAVTSASDVFVRATLEDGDSISVREALSSGVRVVASRVGTRPSGAVLFERGNVDDLVAKLSSAPRPHEGGGPQERWKAPGRGEECNWGAAKSVDKSVDAADRSVCATWGDRGFRGCWKAPGRGKDCDVDDCMDRLLEIYRSVDPSEGALCLN